MVVALATTMPAGAATPDVEGGEPAMFKLETTLLRTLHPSRVVAQILCGMRPMRGEDLYADARFRCSPGMGAKHEGIVNK